MTTRAATAPMATNSAARRFLLARRTRTSTTTATLGERPPRRKGGAEAAAGITSTSGVHVWMTLVILGRELLVTSIRGVMEGLGHDLQCHVFQGFRANGYSDEFHAVRMH